MTNDTKPYRVDFWGSHPDLGNDDCWMGESYATLQDAITAFESDPHELMLVWRAESIERRLADLHRSQSDDELVKMVRMNLLASAAGDVCNTAYIALDGPGVAIVRANPHFSAKRAKLDDAACKREQAMEAGMLHGVDAYNEIMEQES